MIPFRTVSAIRTKPLLIDHFGSFPSVCPSAVKNGCRMEVGKQIQLDESLTPLARKYSAGAGPRPSAIFLGYSLHLPSTPLQPARPLLSRIWPALIFPHLSSGTSSPYQTSLHIRCKSFKRKSFLNWFIFYTRYTPNTLLPLRQPCSLVELFHENLLDIYRISRNSGVEGLSWTRPPCMRTLSFPYIKSMMGIKRRGGGWPRPFSLYYASPSPTRTECGRPPYRS